MLNSNYFIRFIVCLAGLFFLLGGCDKQAETPPKPKVITKKIVARKGGALPPKAKAAAPKQPVVKKKAPVQAKAKPALAQAPQPKAAAQPASRPKAVTVTQPVPKPEVKTAAKPAPVPKVEIAAKQVPIPKPQPAVAATKVVPEAKDKEVAPAEPTLKASQLLLKGMSVYNPEGRLDPFAPLFEEKQAAPTVAARPKKPVRKRVPLTPLEKVDLSQLKLVAIIQALSGNKAMVTEASGKGYIVKKGTLIGNRSGKIVDILPDKIVVEEEIEDVYSGKVTVKKRLLQIQKPLGE